MDFINSNKLEYTRLTLDTIKQSLFLTAWSLYKHSFPDNERRSLISHKNIMKNPQYYFEVISMKNTTHFIGFIAWWEFENLRYIEHLAIASVEQGKGYGLCILQDFIARLPLPVLLEVAPPDSDTDKRRITFYQRAGFILNEQPYKHPPYKKGNNREYVSLKLMTYPNAITDNGLQYFLEKCHPIIHKLVLK